MKTKFPTHKFFSKSRKLFPFNRTSGAGFWLGIVPLLWVLVLFILPLLIVLKLSFAESVFAIPPFSEIISFTGEYFLELKLNLGNYEALLHDTYYTSAFINSTLLAATATVICFLLGFPMAYGIHNSSKNLKLILLLLLSLSFWTSFLIRIYAWMNLLSCNGLLNSALLKLGIIDAPLQLLGTYSTVCLGLVFCYLPFMVFPVYAVLEKVDRSYIEAAHDLGCPPTKAFWTITIPLSKSGILTGGIVVFATSIGEFTVPELLGDAETITFGRVLWNEFFSNLDWTMACALSIAMMICVVLPVFLLQRRARI